MQLYYSQYRGFSTEVFNQQDRFEEEVLATYLDEQAWDGTFTGEQRLWRGGRVYQLYQPRPKFEYEI